MAELAPAAALGGGALIGIASVLMLALFGRIAGISGIVARLLPPYADRETGGRAAFLLGLIGAPLLLRLLAGEMPAITVEAGPIRLLAAGLLVGFGAVYGGGCTSGHGVCGLSRLSRRSGAAVAVFMGTAAATVYLARHVIGG